VRDDLTTFSDIRNLDLVETLFALIPSKVGSPFSINNLAGDLQVAFDTVKNWLLLFDSFYLTFRVAPWTIKISRSILKEKKSIYLIIRLLKVRLRILKTLQHWNYLRLLRCGKIMAGEILHLIISGIKTNRKLIS
jgi:predicted AAA+ superfamily ATPase